MRIVTCIIVLVVLMSVVELTACSDPQGAERALVAQGFKEIKTTGYQFWGCDEKDLWRTGFEAVGPTGVKVTGVVCSGTFKGSTVRTF